MKLLGPFSALAGFCFHKVIKHFEFQLILNPNLYIENLVGSMLKLERNMCIIYIRCIPSCEQFVISVSRKGRFSKFELGPKKENVG